MARKPRLALSMQKNEELTEAVRLVTCLYSKSTKIAQGVFSGPCFLVFGLNTGKYRPEKNPNLDTFHAVWCFDKLVFENRRHI